MNSNHPRQSPSGYTQHTPFYCPTQQPQYDFEQNIDPQLRSSPSTTRQPQPQPTLVPANFDHDVPYIPSQHQNHQHHHDETAALDAAASQGGSRTLRPRESHQQKQWDGSYGAVGSNYRRTARPPDGQPQPFNREQYAGYDERGHRRGYEHLQGTPAPANGNHYRERTHEYSTSRASSSQSPYGVPPLGSGQTPYASSSYVPPVQIHAVNPTILQQPHMAIIDANGLPRVKTPQELLGLDPNAPISLDSLRDPPPGQKPEYTLPVLVKIAILSSPREALSLQEIYAAIEKRFSWFKNCENPKSWRMSIRHSLSLHAVFQKIPRPANAPGKGHLWTVDFSKGEGNKRPRKRNRPPPKGTKKGQQAEDDGFSTDSESSGTGTPVRGRQVANAAAPDVGNKRGKPIRKAPYPNATQRASRRRLPTPSDIADGGTTSALTTPSARDGSLPPIPINPLNDTYNNGRYVHNGQFYLPDVRGVSPHDVNGGMGPGHLSAYGQTPPPPMDSNCTGGFEMLPRVPVGRLDDEVRDDVHGRRYTNGFHNNTNGFLSHTNGTLPFGVGANPDAPTPHFGRPRDDIVLVNNGGLPCARRIVRRPRVVEV